MDSSRRRDAIDRATELFAASGDKLCIEFVFSLRPGSLTDVEERANAISASASAVECVVDDILHSHAATQTKNTNKLFTRLAAYTRGHANLLP